MRSRSIQGLVLALAISLAFCVARSAPAHAAPGRAAPGKKTTVAILYFDYSGTTEDMQFLRKGLTQMLVSDLAGTPGITVVERTRLEEILAELDLAKDTRIDPDSAIRVGKLLSARYMILGGYLDFRGHLQVSVRLVDVETGEVIEGKSRRTKLDDFFRLEQVLAEDIRGLVRKHLVTVARSSAQEEDGVAVAAAAPAPAPAPKRTRSRTKKSAKRSSARDDRAHTADKGSSAARRSAVGGSATDKKAMAPQLDASTAARYGRALDAMDRGDKASARSDLEAVVAKSPAFQLASVDLASLAQ